MPSRRGSRRKIAKPPSLLLRSFFVLWILDAGMEHILKSKSESLSNNLKLLQRKVTFVQLPLRDPAVHDVTDKLLNFLRSRFFEASGSALYRIGETDDSAFFKLRFRPTVSKTFLAHLRDVLLPDVH